LDKENLVRFY